MVTFRTCVVHSTRRPVHFLNQFGPRPCKYKCKSIHPCTSQSLSSSHRSMTTAHRVLPSKRFKRGVLKSLFKRLRIKKKSRPITYCIEQCVLKTDRWEWSLRIGGLVLNGNYNYNYNNNYKYCALSSHVTVDKEPHDLLQRLPATKP